MGQKDGEGFIPALFKPCAERCPNSTSKGKHKKHDCGGGAWHRLGVNVTHLTCLVLDLDNIAPGWLEAALAAIAAENITHIWWHTHSHTPEHPKARIVIPFAAPLAIANPRQWSLQAWPQLMEFFGVADMVKSDESCRDPSRLYYTPRKPSETSPHQAGWHNGVLFDPTPHVTLTDSPEGIVLELPDEDPSRPVDIAALREKLSHSPRPEVRRLLKGEALSPPPDKRGPEDKPRYLAWRDTLAALTMRTEGWESRAALWQLLEPSWDAEVRESPDDHTPREIIEGLLETAMGSAPGAKARYEARQEERKREGDWRKYVAHVQHGGAEKPTEPDDSGGPSANSAAPGSGDGLEWLSACTTMQLKSGDIRPTASLATFKAALALHPELRGSLRYNKLSGRVEFHNPSLGAPEPRAIQDQDYTNLICWFNTSPDFGFLRIGVETMVQACYAVAHANSYDALIDYLDGLPAWDGEDRLNTWLTRYMGAASTDAEGRDITAHTSAVGRKWLVAAIARGYEPGCKADNTLTFEGLEGIGKSTVAAILGAGLGTDAALNFTNKDTWDVLSSAWVVEMPEMSAFSRSEVREQKSFLTKTNDTYRKSYHREPQTRHRRCVFINTTNEEEYLMSDTGNRRIWPIRLTGKIDVVGLRRDVQQLHAQAKAVYLAANECAECSKGEGRCAEHRWWLTSAEEEFARTQVDQRRPVSPIAERLEMDLVALPPEQRPLAVTAPEVAKRLGLEEKYLTDRGLQTAIGVALKRLGFAKAGRRGSVLSWNTPDTILKAPRRGTPSAPLMSMTHAARPQA